MDTRRSARISSKLWVAVNGVDDEPRCRNGDVSHTGVFFESDRPVGDVGSVQWLHLASLDRRRSVDVMATVIRVVSSHDLIRGQSLGVALEFMPDNEECRRSVEQLVQHVLSDWLDDEKTLIDGPIELDLPSITERPRDAPQKRIGPRQMVLDTKWPVLSGDKITIEIGSPASPEPLRFRATAVRVVPDKDPRRPRYRIELDLPPSADNAAGADAKSLAKDLHDHLFTEASVSQAPGKNTSRKEHLTGLLSRIRLPTLLSLFEMERMSGELRLERASVVARLFLDGGRLIDAELPSAATVRAALLELITWDTGEFRFEMLAVDRPDRFGVSTTGLLLDLAREMDERNQT